MSIYVNIKKSFGEFALDVEFCAENEILALLGASGCGKSMTLKCIAGIVQPDSGKIIVDNVTLFDSEKHINLPPQERHVGLLFQNYALFPNMTVRQNIYSVLKRRKAEKDPRERLDALMETFYINGLEEHYPAQLSGGQQQRVALARIIASDPKIIMLDEPLSALDSYLRWHVEQELILLLRNFSGTTLYVSHNRDEVYRICGKVCVINKGRSEKPCTVRELFSTPPTLASALLSGCKNYSRVKKIGNNRLYAVDWDVDLQSSADVSDEVRYIGVRAHYIASGRRGEDNSVTCRVLGITHDIFSTIIILLPLNSDIRHKFSHIRMEIPKHEAAHIEIGEEITIKINPEDIMLLK